MSECVVGLDALAVGLVSFGRMRIARVFTVAADPIVDFLRRSRLVQKRDSDGPEI